MLARSFGIFFTLSLALLGGCASNYAHKSLPNRASEFTKEALSYDGCPYGRVPGTAKMGTKTDSLVESYQSSRYGSEAVIRYKQEGYLDTECATEPPRQKQPRAPAPAVKGKKK